MARKKTRLRRELEPGAVLLVWSPGVPIQRTTVQEFLNDHADAEDPDNQMLAAVCEGLSARDFAIVGDEDGAHTLVMLSVARETGLMQTGDGLQALTVGDLVEVFHDRQWLPAEVVREGRARISPSGRVVRLDIRSVRRPKECRARPGNLPADEGACAAALRAALEAWADQFDGPADEDLDVSGADLVDWFTEWRGTAKAALAAAPPRSS